MPGCSLKEAFPDFSVSVNPSPKLPSGVQRYGVEVQKNNLEKPPGEDSLFAEPSSDMKNIAPFQNTIPSNIEKMLENSVNLDLSLDCDSVVQHFKECKRCQSQVALKNKVVIRENFSSSEQVMELSTFLAIGIFIIIILDRISK